MTTMTITEREVRELLARGEPVDIGWQQTGGPDIYGDCTAPEPVYWLLVTRYDHGYGEHADLVLADGTREWTDPAECEAACRRVWGRPPRP